MWKIGEVAKRAGVSVRTLHYYEEIGLLRPDGRTASDHRLYGARALERLQQIKSLQALGLELSAIAEALDRPGFDPAALLRDHITHVRTQRRALVELEQTLERLLQLVERRDHEHEASGDVLLHTLEVMTMHEKYYTPEQLDTLEQRRQSFDEADMQAVQQAWADLYDQLRAHMAQGLAPEDPANEPLAAESERLIGLFTGGDTGIRQSLNTLWQEEPKVQHSHGMDPALFAYMGEVKAAWPHP